MPLAIILSLPIGIAGSFLFTWIFGLDSNIYFQISLIMLIGLLSKNAILIGDSHSDIVLANSIEALPILVKTGNGKETLSKLADSNIKYLCFESLEDATEAIIKKSIIRS